MYPHRIRLRGPWECDATGSRVTMPGRFADIGLTGVRGEVRFTRKFGYPGKADPEFEHLWLTCEGCTDCRAVRLNGTLLSEAPGESFAFDVSRLLGERNLLEITIDSTSDAAGIWGDAALEIRKDAYLSNVRVEPVGPTLIVTGAVVGTGPHPLELYTLLNQRHADYRTIAPCPAGTPFRIELADVPPQVENVRVELIYVSEIWYAVEVPADKVKVR
jgi:hypothetical protein